MAICCIYNIVPQRRSSWRTGLVVLKVLEFHVIVQPFRWMFERLVRQQSYFIVPFRHDGVHHGMQRQDYNDHIGHAWILIKCNRLAKEIIFTKFNARPCSNNNVVNKIGDREFKKQTTILEGNRILFLSFSVTWKRTIASYKTTIKTTQN